MIFSNQNSLLIKRKKVIHFISAIIEVILLMGGSYICSREMFKLFLYFCLTISREIVNLFFNFLEPNISHDLPGKRLITRLPFRLFLRISRYFCLTISREIVHFSSIFLRLCSFIPPIISLFQFRGKSFSKKKNFAGNLRPKISRQISKFPGNLVTRLPTFSSCEFR